MEKRLVILIPLQPLLSEGLQHIFSNLEDVELHTLGCTDLISVESCLSQLHPDMVLLAGDKEDDQIILLISKILKRFQDIPIVWAELESNNLRLYTSHTLTANSSELIYAIRENAAHKIVIHPIEKKDLSEF